MVLLTSNLGDFYNFIKSSKFHPNEVVINLCCPRSLTSETDKKSTFQEILAFCWHYSMDLITMSVIYTGILLWGQCANIITNNLASRPLISSQRSKVSDPKWPKMCVYYDECESFSVEVNPKYLSLYSYLLSSTQAFLGHVSDLSYQ